MLPARTGATPAACAAAVRRMTNGTTRPSYRKTSQRIGRPKRNSPRPSSSAASQRIAFGKARSRSTAASTPPSTDRVARPRCRCRYARYSPFPVATRSSAATSTPCLRAKPSAARVGSPDASNAARAGGPVTISSRPVCRPASSATVATSRRGPAKALTGVRRPTRAASSRSASRAASCASMPGIQLAGISSQPISSSSSRNAMLRRPPPAPPRRPTPAPRRRGRRQWRPPACGRAGCTRRAR